jgi:uncharacterized protein YxeA
MRLRINLNISKKVVIVALVILIVATVGSILYLKQSNKNPLPPSIKSHVGYKIIYPSKTGQIDSNSYSYLTDKKTLTFSVNKDGKKIVFTEQPAPEALGSDTQAYYPALGIHPYAQFKTSLGQVALTKFWQSGTLKPIGQSAILASNGTFVIAHSEKNLTNAEWKDLFESLKITR